MKKILFYTFIQLCVLSVFGQNKLLTGKLENVSQSGYYNIQLHPQLVGSSAPSFNNLRLLDGQAKEVPYFVRSQVPVKEIKSFEEYVIASQQVKDSTSTVVISNEKAQVLDRFCIVTSNANTDKRLRIRGSNDQQQWYIVKKQEDVSFGTFKYSDTENMLMVDFPKGNYKYYEVEIVNSQPSPIRIVKVGAISNSNIYAQLTEIDLGKWTQKDSTNKISYIIFDNLPYTCLINKLELDIDYKANYLRKGTIVDQKGNSIVRFTVSSQPKDNKVLLNEGKIDKQSRIEIDNGDNPPLTISAIRGYAVTYYMCAYLEAGQAYSLQVNTSGELSAPNYDIQHFEDKISENLPILKTISVSETQIKEAAPREKMWIEKPLFLWSSILIVGLILTALCVQMVWKMKKEKK